MAYEVKEIVEMLKVFHKAESEVKNFLSFSAFSLKNKIHKKKSAESTLNAIENYRKLPLEIKENIEKDKEIYLRNIDEIERLCKEALNE